MHNYTIIIHEQKTKVNRYIHNHKKTLFLL